MGFYAHGDIKASEKRAELNAYCTGDLEVWDLEIWDMEVWDMEVWDLICFWPWGLKNLGKLTN